MKKIIITLVSTLALWGCVSSSSIVDYKGGKVDIELKNSSISSELISVQDEELIVDYQNKISSVMFKDIKSISAQPYALTAKSSIFYFQIIPAAIFGIAAASNTESPAAFFAGAVLMVPGLITYLIYDANIPEALIWDDSMPMTSLKEFRLYARVPDPLSDEQLSELLKLHNQNKIEKLK